MKYVVVSHQLPCLPRTGRAIRHRGEGVETLGDKSKLICIHLDSASKRPDLPEYDPEKCPKCGGPVVDGFGLAGGGYGVYTYCDACGEIVSKTEVEE